MFAAVVETAAPAPHAAATLRGRLHLFRRELDHTPAHGRPAQFLKPGVFVAVLATPTGLDPSTLLRRAQMTTADLHSCTTIYSLHGRQESLLVSFATPAEASRFHERTHGSLFNKLRTEVCYCVHLSGVEYITPDVARTLSWQPVDHVELPICPVGRSPSLARL